MEEDKLLQESELDEIDAYEAPIDDLRAKTLDMLDYHAIRQRVADHTRYFPARQLALQLTPSYDADEVEYLQRETAEGRILLDYAGEINLHAATDPSAAVARADLGGVLTGNELLAVAESLEVQQQARAAASRMRDKTPLLAAIAEGIPDHSELRRQIRRRIGERGGVMDDATPTLRAVRRQTTRAYERVVQALNKIMQSSAGREALQDQVVSIRGDRLVVPVKSEMRHRLPGIIHDASNTGATVFIEPFETVDLGNDWKELTLEEDREVRRVLRDLSSLVGELADDIQRGIELAARLDFILARARYSIAIRGVPAVPLISRQQREDDTQSSNMAVRLLKARHPLLGSSGVPININIGPDWSVLVITGPNTGGKTVAMKTVGLLALIHQSGLQIPAQEGSSIPVFDGVFADVGDQQSIAESVSTFSSHMRNVIEILGEAGPRSLVLLDELGTSTDPEEGSALAKAILEHLASKGVSTIVTTHHRNVAVFAEATPAMMNASVQLEPSTMRPTYDVTMGVPGSSYAMSVASHLGLTPEIMERAESLLEPQYLRFEDWLNELNDRRQQLQLRLEEAEQAQAQSESLRQRLEEQLDFLVTHREDILDNVRRAVDTQYEVVRRKLRRAEAALSWQAPTGDVEAMRAEVAEVAVERQEIQVRQEQAPTPVRRVPERPIQVGDSVHIRGLNLKGTVTALPDQNSEAEVSVGMVRMRLNINRVALVEEAEEDRAIAPQVSLDFAPSLTSMELDLRGQRAEEALANLEVFLDSAVRDGLSSVRIIHGRGTGVLRQVVRDHLLRHPLARSFESEARERGGNGATLVELA